MGARELIRLSLAEECRLVESVSALVAVGHLPADAYALVGAAAYRDGTRGRVAATAASIAHLLADGLPLRTAARSTLARVDRTHLALLSVIDATGEAASALERAARFLRTRCALRRSTVGALIYPAVVATATLAGAVLMLTVVLPAAEELFASVLPGGAAAGGGDIATVITRGRNATVLVGAALAAVVGCALGIAASRAGDPRLVWLDRVRLRLPIVGPNEARADLLAFTHALVGTLRAGLSTPEALAAAAGCPGNAAISGRLADAADAVRLGASPGATLAKAFGALHEAALAFTLCDSGSDLAETAGRVARTLESDLEASAHRVAVLLEPALIAIAGALVLTLALTVVVPLFELYAEVLP